MHWNMYESGWTEGSLQFRKSLVFAMARSYTPATLTAGKFYNVNLNSFTQVCFQPLPTTSYANRKRRSCNCVDLPSKFY